MTFTQSDALNLGKEPFVSVVMNCYNSAKYLRESIDSVLAQTYKNWEIIFWDNQSTDESAKIFLSYTDDRFHYYLAPEFTKLGLARNLAVAQAKGDWLGFLDCDDMWLPTKLEQQVDIVIHESSDLGLVYGQCLVIKGDSEVKTGWAKGQYKYSNKTNLTVLPEGWVLQKLLRFNFIPLLTAIVPREVYHEIGGISAHFEQAEDYELFVKIAATKKVRAVQDVVALYRVHSNNISHGNEEKSFAECIEIVSRFLPDPIAKAGLHCQHTIHAIILAKNGNLISGLLHFIRLGSLIELYMLMFKKITCKF